MIVTAEMLLAAIKTANDERDSDWAYMDAEPCDEFDAMIDGRIDLKRVAEVLSAHMAQMTSGVGLPA